MDLHARNARKGRLKLLFPRRHQARSGHDEPAAVRGHIHRFTEIGADLVQGAEH